MPPLNFPTFTPETISMVDDRAELTGLVSSEEYLGQKWIGEKWLGYIARWEEPPVRGRWFSESEKWRFVVGIPGARGYRIGEPLTIYDGYWGERANIVLAPLTWTEQIYVSKTKGDHDHCGICWATIFCDEPQYFHSSDRDVVCPTCYEAFVRTRSLAFIGATPLRELNEKPGSRQEMASTRSEWADANPSTAAQTHDSKRQRIDTLAGRVSIRCAICASQF